MEKFQSDPDKLTDKINKLQKKNSGKYTFIWNHPIKLPLENSAINEIKFWDRKNDLWITLDLIIDLPKFNDFPSKNISLLPDEKDHYLIMGSFQVTIKKSKKNWKATIEIII